MFRTSLQRIGVCKQATGLLRPVDPQLNALSCRNQSRLASTIARDQLSLLDTGSHTFILPNKHNLGHHVLGYHVVGKPTGQPVFYFHGSPSSRTEADYFDTIGRKLDLCVIGVDRPGIGLSTFRPGYTLLDWPHDIQKLATHLGFEQFKVIGGSGGGPYALACAHELPENVLKGTGVLAGLAPPDAPYKNLSWDRLIAFIINRWSPRWLLHFIIENFLARHARNPDQTQWNKIMIDGIVKRTSPKDQALFDEEEIEKMSITFREACLSGVDGYVLDAQSILRRWPFGLRSIKGKVKIWNGTEDVNTPIHMARWMVDQLPNGSLREFDGDTHYSIFLRRSEEVMKDLSEM